MREDLISPQAQFEQFDSNPNEELKKRYLKKLDRAYEEGGITAVKELASRTFDDTTIDDLTGLLNRRVFFTLIRKIVLPHMNRIKRSTEQFSKLADVQSEGVRSYGSLVVLDLDRFKLINEHFGHAGGDKVLRTFGAMSKAHFREEDVIGRVGGDEIVIIAVELTVGDVKSRMGVEEGETEEDDSDNN
jgi:GGDEF domain-containing protein